MKYVLCWIINKLRTFNYILSQLLNTLKWITFNLCSFNINMLSLVVLHPERNRRRLRDSRQSDHDNFAVPERSENVWISLGEADGLYGQLEGEGGDQVDGVEVPHTQVAVLVSVQKVVVAGQQTWVSHDKWKSILNTRRGDEHQNRGVSGYFPRRKEPKYMYSRQESLCYFGDHWNGGIPYRTFKNRNNEGRGHNMLKVDLLWYVFMYF